ncbi:hypothetical protein GCM10027040_30640 [Halomonas shantousis]
MPDIQAPKGAYTTWRALYAGLRAFREEMQHIHLENNVLFEKVTSELALSNELPPTSLAEAE